MGFETLLLKALKQIFCFEPVVRERIKRVAPECTLDDGAGRHIKLGWHVSLRPPPNFIGLWYSRAYWCRRLQEHSFIYVFMNDLRCFGCITEILIANNNDFS